MEVVHNGSAFAASVHHDTYAAIDPSKRDFSGRYVFVTGASKGIGRETALSYASAGAAGIGLGARSDLSDLVGELAAAARAASKAPPQVLAVQLDVADEASVAAAAAAVAKAFPRLDILINNAGYLEKRQPIATSDPVEWWKTWNVNVLGTYLMTRAFLREVILPRPGGDRTIVNLCSIAAHHVAPGGSSYQTSKLAVLRFTEFLNVDHGVATDDAVLTYAIHPGGVPTDMGRRLPAHVQAVLLDSPKLCADVLVALTEQRHEWLAARYLSATWDVDELLSRKDEIVKGNKLKVRLADE